MANATLHYIHDPLCGWCYAAEPMVLAAADAGISVVLHGGGLWDRKTHVDAEKRSYIRASDARIGAMTGQKFGSAYLDGLLSDATTTWWSRPVIAAVLAADRLNSEAGIKMMTGIQFAHYVDGKRVVDEDVLVELASSLGLEQMVFRDALRRVPVDDHIQKTRELMRRWGLHGYPSFLIDRDGDIQHVAHESFYGRPADFVAAVRNNAGASGG